nr:Gfo/Idh/MocA family oxidoreductase [Frondihabitans sucicola]
MSSTSLVSRLGRRVRFGIIGGGLDSVIGGTHLLALRTDGLADIVAGAMSIDPAVADASAAELLIDPSRRYASWQDLLAGETAREDGVDAVVVITPPQFHGEISMAFLQAGINVLCEKPTTSTAADAAEVVRVADESGALFTVTHCYTGYPMVREAKELVRTGVLGRITLVEGRHAAGDPGVLREPEDSSKRHWHFKPSSMGKAVVLGEVGSHAHNIVEYVTGQRVIEVTAQLTTIAKRREIYDNAYLTLSFSDGAVGRLWSSFVAAGNEHGLAFAVYGDDGSLHWDQESPEYLWLRRPGEAAIRISRGLDSTSEASQAATRIRPGHPEGYIMAFANIYRDFFSGVLLRLLGESSDEAVRELPTARDGLSTIRLIEAAVESHDRRSPVEIVL